MALQEFVIIRTYLPVDGGQAFATFDDMLKACPALGKILALIDRSGPVGVLGNYRSVFELQYGFEGFTPESGAKPTKGQLNKKEAVRSVVLTTYLASARDTGALDAFVDELAEAHPWEHPVIEVIGASSVRVWAAAKQKRRPQRVSVNRRIR
jgi:hypothetical protein